MMTHCLPSGHTKSARKRPTWGEKEFLYPGPCLGRMHFVKDKKSEAVAYCNGFHFQAHLTKVPMWDNNAMIQVAAGAKAVTFS